MAKIVGTNGRDMIRGTNGNDTISGLKGNDLIDGRGGNDNIVGGEGHDKVHGSGGHDWIDGGAGSDALAGDDGNDWLFGGSGDDWMEGGTGNDCLFGGDGNDKLRGGAGNDHLNGGAGLNDDVRGGAGNDALVFESRAGGILKAGTSQFWGESGNDTLELSANAGTNEFGDPYGFMEIMVGAKGAGTINYSADPIENTPIQAGTFSGIENFRMGDGDMALIYRGIGGDLDAKVTGSNKADTFEGGRGDETFIGGAGADDYLFLYRAGIGPIGHDRIVGFNAGEDHIATNGFIDTDTKDIVLTVTASESNGWTTFTSKDSGGNVVHILDVDAVGLAPDTLYAEYLLG